MPKNPEQLKLEEIKIISLVILSFITAYYLLGTIVFAVVIAYFAIPLRNSFECWIKNRTLSAGLTTFVVFSIIIYPLLLSMRSLIVSAPRIVPLLNSSIEKIFEFFQSHGFAFSTNMHDIVIQKGLSMLSGIVFRTPELFIKGFVGIMLVFYFLENSDKIKKYINGLAKTEHQSQLFKEIENLLGAVIFGYFAKAIVMGIITGIVFWLLGFKSAVLFAFAMGIVALLPVVGPWTILIPLIIYEYILGNSYLVVTLASFAFFMQFLEVWLAPKLSGMKANVHPAIMLVGFVGGIMAFGIKGLVLGPIILGVFKVLMDHYRVRG